MALDQPALLEVLDALKIAEVDDRFRQAAETIYQALVEAELSGPLTAGRASPRISLSPKHGQTRVKPIRAKSRRQRSSAETPAMLTCHQPIAV
jgi:hypothetical protein